MSDPDAEKELLGEIEAWEKAIRFYRSGEARAISRRLIPLLLGAGAIDRSTAVEVEGVAYWVRSSPSTREVARERVKGKGRDPHL